MASEVWQSQTVLIFGNSEEISCNKERKKTGEDEHVLRLHKIIAFNWVVLLDIFT